MSWGGKSRGKETGGTGRMGRTCKSEGSLRRRHLSQDWENVQELLPQTSWGNAPDRRHGQRESPTGQAHSGRSKESREVSGAEAAGAGRQKCEGGQGDRLGWAS